MGKPGVETTISPETKQKPETRNNFQKYLSGRCCFCIPLRVGCFIIGYISLITNFIHTNYIVYFFVIALKANGETLAFHRQDKWTKVDATSSESQDLDHKVYNICQILILVLFINLAWLFINLAAVIGLHMRKPGPIRLFVIFAVARLAISVICQMLYPARIFTHVVDIAFGLHFVLVYYFYVKELTAEIEKQKENNNDAMGPKQLYNVDVKDEKTGTCNKVFNVPLEYVVAHP